MEKNKQPIRVSTVLIYVFFCFMMVLYLAPLGWIILTSLKTKTEIYRTPFGWPKVFQWGNYVYAWKGGKLGIAMLNSLFVAGCSAVLCTYFSTMTAYAIHVYNFRFKKFMSTFILAVMMIPTQVTALGFLQLVGKMKLEDNFIPLIVPTVAAPVTYFYMKQYMESTLPLSLIEAARIDGSGEFRTFNTITLPLMKPAIAVQAIFTFVSSWNNYFIPALVLHKDKMKTLPILIAQLRSADFLKFNMGHVYAAIAFSIFPVIVVYLILSKYIVGGTTLGGVKG